MNVLLGVSGSISAYRAADLARDLMRAGHTVRACLTDGAQQFVTATLFATLTGQPVGTDTFHEPEPGRIAHIDWARWAQVIVIAPATANTINRIAYGFADDMLTTIAIAADAPLVIAPAMNPQMYTSENVQEALDRLESRGAVIVPPTEGDVVSGETGTGKLAANADIAHAVADIGTVSQRLTGRRVLITSGPTQEPIDPVRYVSNRSSGRMGSALAQAALRMGAEVTVVAGPQSAPVPRAARTISVRTALEMQRACHELGEFDLIIAAAAVADYRVAEVASAKIRRTGDDLTLRLVPNPDIIAGLAQLMPDARIVAFAAETGEAPDYARDKMRRKGAYAIAMNDVSRADIGFDVDRNEITLLYADGRSESSGRMSKLAIARWLLERVTDPAAS